MNIETAPDNQQQPEQLSAELASSAWGRSMSDRHVQDDLRVGATVLLFFVLDATFLAAWAMTGKGSLVFAGLYLLVGGAGAGFFAWSRRYRRDRKLGDSNAHLALTVVTLGLTMGIAWVCDDLVLPMLLTVIVMIATGAMRLPPRRLVALCVASAAMLVGVLVHAGHPPALPMDSATQQVLSGLFLLWTLFKAASVNAIGLGLRKALDESHAQLAATLMRVESLANQDELTGLPNRRRILVELGNALNHRTLEQRLEAVAILDVDHFKQINDRFGHPVGDAVLSVLGRVLPEVLRCTDHVGRVGGEEFLLLFCGPGSSKDACVVAERVRETIAGHAWAALERSLSVTASIGLAAPRTGERVDELLARADLALYRAKQCGRNQVVGEVGIA